MIASQFEPLMPEESSAGSLHELASSIKEHAIRLDSALAAPAKHSLATLLRAMNSYYTNKIEGQHTTPAELEQALNNHYDAEPTKAKKQRLALAHMATEHWGETAWANATPGGLYNEDVITKLHENLFGQLPETDRITDDQRSIEPGTIRTQNVRVGKHVAPEQQKISAFLNRWSTAYGQLPRGEKAIIGAACSHHRLTWIHPFIDGNGRVARLHTHLVLHSLGLTNGLWSPMRGLARNHAEYYSRLSAADEPRKNDLDGRGNLSQQGLIEFCEFFLNICLDQITFMAKMLDVADAKRRLYEALLFHSAHSRSDKLLAALEPLHYTLLTGELDRQTFKQMCGLASRTADRVMADLLKIGLLTATSPKGPVHFSVPFWSLKYLFPKLWPEAEQA